MFAAARSHVRSEECRASLGPSEKKHDRADSLSLAREVAKKQQQIKDLEDSRRSQLMLDKTREQRVVARIVGENRTRRTFCTLSLRLPNSSIFPPPNPG